MHIFFKGLLATALGVAIAGCGGSNGSSPIKTRPTTGAPTGRTATRALITSGYQSFQAAVNYPLAGLQLALPPSSPFRVDTARSNRTVQGALNVDAPISLFNKDLGLYQTFTRSSNSVTIKYFSDAALTQNVGSSSLVAPVGETLGGNYSKYPTVIRISQNVTGGNIPCQGAGTITINSARGANVIDGTLNLPRTGLRVTANLTLNDAGQVGGVATIVGNGQTIQVNNLAGPFPGDLTGAATANPGGAKGTATLNLLTGKFELDLLDSSGTSRTTLDSSGNLKIAYADGTVENLNNPLAVTGGQLPGPTPTTGPTTTPTTAPTTGPTTVPTTAPTTPPATVVYQTPINIPNFRFLSGKQVLNNAGQMVGLSANNDAPVFLSGPTATQLVLKSSGQFPLGLSDNGAIYGYTPAGKSYAFWSSPTAQVQLRGDAIFYDINDSGQLVGADPFGTFSHTALFFTSGSADKTPLALLSGTDEASAFAINKDGFILGRALNTVVYWTSPTAQPQILQGASSQALAFDVNAKKQLILSTGALQSSGNLFYASPTSNPTQLPFLPGASTSSGGQFGARALNDNSIVVGTSGNAVGARRAVRWVNGQVQDLNSLIPANSGWVLEQAQAINNSGVIVGTGKLNGNIATFYLQPK